MATTTTINATKTTAVKKPGPPVPPRPQNTINAAAWLKNHTQSRESFAAATSATAVNRVATGEADRAVTSSKGIELPVIQKKPAMLPRQPAIDSGRTVIYKSPTAHAQRTTEELEHKSSINTGYTIMSAPGVKVVNGTAPKPPLKMRRAPDVPTMKPRSSNSGESVKENENSTKDNTTNNTNNIVIVQSSHGIALNRHNSMGSPKTIGVKDTRLTLNRTESEKLGKIQLDQLQPGQPLPKPRKIVKMPVATLDLDDIEQKSSTHSSGGINIFRRSKTTLDNLASRAHITTINTVSGSSNTNNNTNNSTNSSSGGGFLSGKTVEIKNNLKNAAERLFSEIIVSNQQKQQPAEPVTVITKHERAIQHQALLEQELAMEYKRRQLQQRQQQQQQNTSTTSVPTSPVVTVVTTATPAKEASLNICTRININANFNESPSSPAKSAHIESVLSSPEHKTAFHEMLISELAAMRGRSSSMDNLKTKDLSFLQAKGKGESPKKLSAPVTPKPRSNLLSIKSTTNGNNNKNVSRKRCNSLEDADPDIEDVDADNIEDMEGDEEDMNNTKTLKVNGKNSPRKRCPSGCSSDSSPYGTERSTRIRTSDWIEVGDNGKQVTLTSCHISLEDSGLEDEERLDDMSSSGVGDSWDSVKEAENVKRCRNVKRVMSITDLPPLPKSLSGFTKMLASDSGLVSDADTNAETNNNRNNNNQQLPLECQKDKDNTNTNNNNINNNNNLNGSNEINDIKNDETKSPASDKTAISTTIPTQETNGNGNESAETKESNSITTTTTTAVEVGSTLDTQLAILKKEMHGLRQLDLSLLSQLWALNDSIQEFRTMLEENDGDMYSNSRTPSSYDSGSSEDEEENTVEIKQNLGAVPKIITSQPKLTSSNSTASSKSHTTSSSSATQHESSPEYQTPTPSTTTIDQQNNRQQQRPPIPKPLDTKPVPRMRSAPPPPPVNYRKAVAPPRPT